MSAPTPNTVGDVFAGGAILTSLLGYLPAIAAVIGVIWYLIQIWESKTVQDWYARRAAARKIAKIASLKAQQKILTAELAALEVVRQAQASAVERVEQAKAQAAAEQVAVTTNAEIKKVTDAGK